MGKVFPSGKAAPARRWPRNEALERVKQEGDENNPELRKDFTPEEAVRHADRLTALEAPKAEERKGTRTDLGKTFPEVGSQGRTREKVAPAVGMSGSTHRKAKAVVEALFPNWKTTIRH
jgi:hypothetical protein